MEQGDVNFILVDPDLTEKEHKILRIISKLSVPEQRRIHHLLGAMVKQTEPEWLPR